MGLEFNLPKDSGNNIIKVIGVGGGGSNAVNYMYNLGIKGVDFLVCNTDQQALDASPVPTKVQLGETLTEGRGAGSIPDVGRNAAIENVEDLRTILENGTKMVFVTAGMGGGTGTGAAPVIAEVAKELGILTVGIVTIPFMFEGKRRMEQAEAGVKALRDSVDTLLIINNEKLREMFGNLSLANAFSKADDVLCSAAKGIAEVISVTGLINVDFNDVNTVMKNSGVAIMGSAEAEGEDRAIKAVQDALSSPLLNDNDINGAKHVLLNITYGDKEVLMDEISDITDYIQSAAGSSADVIWGHGYDADLGEKLSVTIVATGFKTSLDTGLTPEEPAKKYLDLEKDTHEVKSHLTSPTESIVHNTFKEEIKEETYDEPFLKKNEVKEEEADMETYEASTSTSTSTASWDVNAETKSEEFEFEVETEVEVKKYNLEDVMEDEDIKAESDSVTNLKPSKEEQQKLANERIARIREISMKLRTPTGITDLENEPAYKRRNIDLDDVKHSSESEVSRYTLSDEEQPDGSKRPEIKGNNSFLHDNVD